MVLVRGNSVIKNSFYSLSSFKAVLNCIEIFLGIYQEVHGFLEDTRRSILSNFKGFLNITTLKISVFLNHMILYCSRCIFLHVLVFGLFFLIT